ncbi:hypothetical protein ABE65_013365 [Fictibacillus phosphorivorans]|uniref:Uncharacterized protein n=1 Tax=Fictibacillus phosphorivorans TaxID=1221500 RepID=A0A160IN22_9BACL|nr:hypothetical protein [Fictibacillus phosphorivorans]ANC77733.1 hypothetical protein ABE65_013365 [Fictibacillus phosphorivorans]
MLIQHIDGMELEKEKPNTSEDFFNRSEVTYEWNGKTQTFHLLYVRYFEEKLQEELTQHEFWKEFLSFYKITEIAALTALLKDSAYLKRKRSYINSYDEFRELFNQPNEELLRSHLNTIKQITK